MRICYLANIDNIHAQRWVRFFASRGNEVFVLCDQHPETAIEEVTVIHPHMNFLTKVIAFKIVRSKHSNDFFKAPFYRKEIQKINPDIVHGIEALVYGFATAKSGNCPKVLQPTGSDVFKWPKISRFARYLVTRALSNADCITTNMPNLDEYLHGEFDVPRLKVKAFSWGINLDIFKIGYEEETKVLRRTLQIPLDAFVVISNRRMHPYWGVERIVDSIPQVLSQNPNVYFVFLTGARHDKDFEQVLRNKISKGGVENNVRFVTDFLSPCDMATYLNMADIFVSVPKTDLLSISILEGMGCGAVPILADLPAYKTRVTHEKNGFFISARDDEAIAKYILACLKNPARMNDIRDYNRRLIEEKEDERKNMLNMEEIYLALLKRKEDREG